MLKRLSGLKNLEFLKCQQLTLSDNSLEGLTRLRRLDLKNVTYDRSSSPNLFRHVPQLEYLVLRDFHVLDHVSVGHLNKLKQIIIGSSSLECQGKIFLNTLERLNHEILNVLEIEGRVERRLGDLCELIQRRFRNLSVLEIEGANLTQGFAFIFDHSAAQCDEFNIDWLAGLSNLRVLRIRLLNFEKINFKFSSPWSSMPRLETLHINHTHNELCKGEFRDLSSLKNLNFTMVTSIEDNVFENLVNLEHLSLGFNCDLTLTQAKLAGLEYLKDLSLFAPTVKIIDLNVFENMPKLESVKLNSRDSSISECLERLEKAYEGRIKFDKS